MLPEIIDARMRNVQGPLNSDPFLNRDALMNHLNLENHRRQLSASSVDFNNEKSCRELRFRRKDVAREKLSARSLEPHKLDFGKNLSPPPHHGKISGPNSTCGSTSTADSDRDDCDSPSLKSCSSSVNGCTRAMSHMSVSRRTNKVVNPQNSRNSINRQNLNDFPPRPYPRSPPLEAQYRTMQQEALLRNAQLQHQRRQELQHFLSQHFPRARHHIRVPNHNRSLSDQLPPMQSANGKLQGQDHGIKFSNLSKPIHMKPIPSSHCMHPIPHSQGIPVSAQLPHVQGYSIGPSLRKHIFIPCGPPKIGISTSPFLISEKDRLHQSLQIQAKIQADFCPQFIIPVPPTCTAHILVLKDDKSEPRLNPKVEQLSDSEIENLLDKIYNANDEVLRNHEMQKRASIKFSAKTATDAWLANKSVAQQAKYLARTNLSA